MHLRWILAAVALAGCNEEYAFYGDDDFDGSYEKPDLSPPEKTDALVQVVSPKVDVLWVIDNSGSMSEEQDKLAREFPAFMEYFLDSGLDYHIGVTTTDSTATGLGGRLRAVGPWRFITPTTTNPVEVFSQLARVGVNGSFDETGSCAAWRALAQPTPTLQQANTGFLREDASLHVVIVTDEQDSSWSFEESPCGGNTTAEFINFLNTFKADPDIPVSFSAIAGPVPWGCRTDPNDPLSGAGAGIPYNQIVDNVGPKNDSGESLGSFFSICDEDWQPVLDELGLIASALRREVFLTEVPVASTISVLVTEDDGDELEGVPVSDLPPEHTSEDVEAACADLGAAVCFAFDYDPVRNAIVFLDYIPPPESTVRITYQLLSGGQESAEFSFDDSDEG